MAPASVQLDACMRACWVRICPGCIKHSCTVPKHSIANTFTNKPWHENNT